MDEIPTTWTGAVRSARYQTFCPGCGNTVRPGDFISQIFRGEGRFWVCEGCGQAAADGRYEEHVAEVKAKLAATVRPRAPSTNC